MNCSHCNATLYEGNHEGDLCNVCNGNNAKRLEVRNLDLVNHPAHYTSHPSGVECIAITEHMSFNVGNAIKYLWRADDKGDPIENLKKAAWYVEREIARRS